MTTLKQLIEQCCPDGVEYVRLGDVATYHRGLTYSKRDEADDGSLRVLRANNVSLERKVIDWEDVKQINPSKAIRESVLLKSNDILMVANSGSKDHVGKIAYVTQDYEDVAFGGFMAAIRTKEGYPSRYIYHHLQSQAFRDYKDGLLATATINNLKGQLVEDFLIPLPPREVQDKIVEYLDTFTALCENLDTDIAQRERQFAAYREKLLSDDYLTTHPCTEGMMKYERLGDVAPYSGSRIASGLLNNSNFVGVDNLLKEMKGKVNSEYGPNTKTVTGFTQGDVLVGNIRPYLRKIWFADVDGGCSGDVLAFHPAGISPRFLYHVLCSERFWSFNVQNSKGAKMPRGDKRILPEFSTPLPPREVQDEIVTKLDAMQELIDNLRMEREQRQQQFDYYRERLLSFPKRNTAEV